MIDLDVSVIIAAYEEEKNLPAVLDGVKKTLPDLRQLIVVDDGSKDSTARVAEEHGAQVIRHETNRGKGAALRTGMAAAKGDIIIFLDADGQDPPSEIPLLLEPFEAGADFVNGSKFIGRCKEGAISGLNRIGNLFMSWLINFLFSAGITDSQSGFKAIRREKIASIPLTATEYEIETQMLIRSIKHGLKIVEVPIIRERRLHGSTHFNRIRNGTRILFLILGEYFSGDK